MRQIIEVHVITLNQLPNQMKCKLSFINNRFQQNISDGRNDLSRFCFMDKTTLQKLDYQNISCEKNFENQNTAKIYRHDYISNKNNYSLLGKKKNFNENQKNNTINISNNAPNTIKNFCRSVRASSVQRHNFGLFPILEDDEIRGD